MPLKSRKGRYLAEAIGTFIFVLVSVGSAIVDILTDGALGLIGIALATGLAVLAVCYSLGHISGAHINPAITIGFATQKKFPIRYVPQYIISQIAGAILACLLLYVLFSNIGNLGIPFPTYRWPLVFLVEFVITFILMLVIMGVATDPRAADPAAAGLPIGLTVVLTSLLALSITGAVMNPARAIAPAIILLDFKWQWVYWSSTILGAIFGAWVYEQIRTAKPPEAEEFGILGPIR